MCSMGEYWAVPLYLYKSDVKCTYENKNAVEWTVD